VVYRVKNNGLHAYFCPFSSVYRDKGSDTLDPLIREFLCVPASTPCGKIGMLGQSGSNPDAKAPARKLCLLFCILVMPHFGARILELPITTCS